MLCDEEGCDGSIIQTRMTHYTHLLYLTIFHGLRNLLTI